MSKLKVALLAAGLIVAGAASAQTADEIIQKHIDAIGGAANWNKIQSMKVTGSMSAQGMEMSFSQTLLNDKGVRRDMSAMGSTGYIIVTPTAGWMYMPGMDKPTSMPEDQVKASKSMLNVRAEQIADKSVIGKAELLGRDTVNSASCYKVKITSKDGNEMTAYFDAATYYLVRNETKIQMQGQDQEVAVTYSNFKKQPEGITIPTAVNMGGAADVTYKTIEINKPVDESIFKPSDIKK